MSEEHLAQHIIERWLISKGYSTSRTVNGQAIIIHYLKYTGFAKLHLHDLPKLALYIYKPEELDRRLKNGITGFDRLIPFYYFGDGDERFGYCELSLADPTCLDKLAEILEKTIFHYIDTESRYEF